MREVEKLSEENLGPAAPATGSVYTTHHSVSGDKLPSMALLTLDFILCILICLHHLDFCHIKYLMRFSNNFPIRGPPLPALCDECLLLTHHPIIAMTILTPLTPAINIFRWLNIF